MTSKDQIKIGEHIAYDSSVALDFFQHFGENISFKQKKTIFSPKQISFLSVFQSPKMYFLAEGKLRIHTADKFYSLDAGNILGEFTPICAKNNKVIAETPCKLITLTEKQLLAGLQQRPEFILMLMEVFVKYLRDSSFNLKTQQQEHISLLTPKDMQGALPDKMLETLVGLVGEDLILDIPPKRVILREGDSAMLMYIILKGYLVTFVGKRAIWRSGPGDVVGEIALIDQKQRTASVMAETRCSLLAVDHKTLFKLVKKLPSFGLSLLRILKSRL